MIKNFKNKIVELIQTFFMFSKTPTYNNKITILDDFWIDENKKYEYFTTLPSLEDRIDIKKLPANQFVVIMKAAGVKFVVSPQRFDAEERNHTRLGLTARHSEKDPIIWINYARHHKKNGMIINDELLDTIIHESAHATGHYLGRRAINHTSDPRVVAFEECVAHGIAALAFRRLGLRRYAFANEDARRKAQESQGLSKDELEQAIQLGDEYLWR
jgi:hypothetical protein